MKDYTEIERESDNSKTKVINWIRLSLVGQVMVILLIYIAYKVAWSIMKDINNVNFLKASAVVDAILTFAAPAIGLMCTVLNGLNITFYVKSKEKKGLTFFISALMLAVGVLNCIFAVLIGITELQYDIRHKFEQPVVKQPYSISKEVEPEEDIEGDIVEQDDSDAEVYCNIHNDKSISGVSEFDNCYVSVSMKQAPDTEENIKLMIPEVTTVDGKLPNINGQLYNTATCDKTVFEDIDDPNFEYESKYTVTYVGYDTVSILQTEEISSAGIYSEFAHGYAYDLYNDKPYSVTKYIDYDTLLDQFDNGKLTIHSDVDYEYDTYRESLADLLKYNSAEEVNYFIKNNSINIIVPINFGQSRYFYVSIPAKNGLGVVTPYEQEVDYVEQPAQNYGGAFIEVNGLIYYTALDKNSTAGGAIWGDFRSDSLVGTKSPLMCYNTFTQETTKVCDAYICDELTYYDGHIYGDTSDSLCNSFVFDVDIANKKVSKLWDGSIAAINSETGDFVVNCGNHLITYSAGECVADLPVYNGALYAGTCFEGDNIFYLENGPDELGVEKYNLGNTSLIQYNITTHRGTYLGHFCDIEDSMGEERQLEQVCVKGDDVYVSLATYAGTGHFMMDSVMGKAKLGTADSLECTVTTEDNSKESGLFIESSLPKYTYTWYTPYQCRFDAKDNRVYYIEEANGKQNDVFVTSLQNYSNYAKQNNHSIDIEVGEYVGDTIYLIVNEIGSCEDYSVGWRDGYKIYNTWYVAVKPGQDAVIMDTYNY